MFCGCELSFGDPPNTHTCPVCLGLPGRAAGAQRARGPLRGDDRARARLARSPSARCFTARTTSIPTSRRATRSPSTTCRCAAAGGWATCGSTACTSRRTPPSSTTSARAAGSTAPTASGVDFNRGGTPLVEIVTEPDLRSPEQAREWLTLLRATLQAARRLRRRHGAGLAARATPTCRSGRAGSTELGTKTELKNMNSFGFLERGVAAEIERQIELLEAGEPVVAGDAPLRSRDRARSRRCAPRRRRTTTATSPSPTSCRCVVDRGDARRRARRAAAGAAGRARGAVRARARPERRSRARCSRSAPSSATTSSGRSRPADGGRRPAIASSPTGSRSWSSGSAPTPIRPSSQRRAREPRDAGDDGHGARRSAATPRARC